jgi:hypothetical protein
MNEFCEKVVAPGIVVGLLSSSDSSQFTWGVTVPYDYWRENSRPDVVDRFQEYSEGNYPQIPYLEFTHGEEWKLRFGSFPTTVKPLCWLEDFFLTDVRKAVPVVLWACSRTDGARYYRELFEWLRLFARVASKDFTDDELRGEPGMRQMIAHARAIRDWQAKNPNWREWETCYEPGHRFHFTLF